MYYQNCGLQKTWLHKCLKSRVSEDSSVSNMVNEIKHAEIQMGPLLPCILITVKAIKFEQVSLSDRQNLTTVF